MCFDADYPSMFEAKIRTARKEYRCCECRGIIGRGEKYEAAHGRWSGEWNWFSTCSRCVEMRAVVEAHEVAAGCHGGEAIPPFGELWNAVHEMTSNMED